MLSFSWSSCLEVCTGLHSNLLYSAFTPNDKASIRIGAAEDNDIVLASGEAYHARIEYKDAGWVLAAVQSPSETWVYVNSWVGMKEDRASPLVRINNNTEIACAGVVFKAIFKSDMNFKIELSDFLEIRRTDFREVYRLGIVLGTGGYSEVHECTHLSSGLKYAVKIIRKTGLNKGQMFEIANLKHLDHPNIIKVHDIIEDERLIFIVTDLCEGGELFDRIVTRGKFSEIAAATTLRDAARAVAYLHSKNIAHRDLKPENLLFVQDTEYSPLKLIDFGAATVVKAGKVKEKIGTPYYVAPEVLKGKGDLRSDIWSLGVILHILLCGVPPFTGRSEKEILNNVTKGKVEFLQPAWEVVSKSARRLVGRMLSLDPAQRPSAQQVLEDPWVQGSARNVNYEADLAEKALGSFRTFNASNKLQQAIMLFIAKSFLSAEEQQFAMQMFNSMDKDSSGHLSKEEVLQGLKQVCMDLSDQDYESLLKELDANLSGVVDYTEFVAAIMSRQQLLSRERLEQVFQVFDRDGSGDITAAELKAVLGQSEEKWMKVIAQVDQNQDGKIDLKEFKNLMLSFLS